jgi:CO dehydrogenase maturation factor
MKIGIVGKGGVGKTTVAAMIARTHRERGARVVAIDTDSNPNLGMSLGLGLAEVDALPALPRSTVTGDGRGEHDAETLLAEYGRATPTGVTLLTGLRIEEAGGGCACGGHATVRSLLSQALEAQADVTIVDMEAGLEHLSRSGGTLAAVDLLVAVVEPSRKSIVTAARTAALAEELGIPRTVVVGNKAHGEEDTAFIAEVCSDYGLPLVGVVSHQDDVREADRTGTVLAIGPGTELGDALRHLVAELDGLVPS